MSRRWFAIGTLIYLLIFVLIFAGWGRLPISEIFTSDAYDYGRAAVHLKHHRFYSLDGVRPFTEREPGYSIFLAVIFLLFGDFNVYTIFIIQGLLFFVTVFLFCRELATITNKRIGGLCFVLLLTCVSVFHALFSAYREGFALILLLVFAWQMLLYGRRKSWIHALLSGFALGFAILTYQSFLFFPLFLLPLFWFHRWNRKHALIIFLVPFVVAAPWFIRNFQLAETESSLASQRLVYVWYVRGEQAERVTGAEPFMCLWAEYISRDWSHRSSACSFNGLTNSKWPQRKPLGNEAQIAANGQRKIIEYFPNYLWFSVFKALELHLPFAGGGWSHYYNIAAMISSVILYVGCIVGMKPFWNRKYMLFAMLPLYNTLFFAFTDATPRYLIPVIFCYCVIGALGYDRILRRFLHG